MCGVLLGRIALVGNGVGERNGNRGTRGLVKRYIQIVVAGINLIPGLSAQVSKVPVGGWLCTS